jgi:hypothetical protein
MLGVGDEEMLYLWRSCGPDEWRLKVSLSDLEKEVKNHGAAFIYRFDSDDIVRMIFIDSEGRAYECVAIDFDDTAVGGVFWFGFLGRDGLDWMQSKDMRKQGFHFQPFSEARVASSP